jgi:hypothetical protein
MATDLFGQPIADAELVQKQPRSRRVRPWKGGYAAQPGSGPAGQRCNTCRHYQRVSGGNRAWPKCALMAHAWTHGPGSDIKAKTPACRRWQERIDAEVEL